MKRILIICMVVIMSLTFAPLQAFAYYEGPVDINESNFSDQGLRELFTYRDQRGDKDGKISPNEWMEPSNYIFSHLSGVIKGCLYSQIQGGNPVKWLGIREIKGIGKLIPEGKTDGVYIEIWPEYNSEFSTPDGIVELETLDLSDVGKDVQKVTVNRSKLKSINLDNCEKMVNLNLSNGYKGSEYEDKYKVAVEKGKWVKDVEGELKILDLSGCKSLEEVFLSYQGTEKIVFSNNEELAVLIVDHCKLPKIDISELHLLSNNWGLNVDLSYQTVEAQYKVENGKVEIPLRELLEEKKYYDNIHIREDKSGIKASFNKDTGVLTYETDDITKVEDPGYDFVMKDGNGRLQTMDVHLKFPEVVVPVEKIKVNFETDGGNPVPDTQEIEKGKIINEPVEPSKEEYKFEGWYTEKVDGEKWNFDNAVNSNMTLYAHWSKIKYDVTSKVVGGTADVKISPKQASKGDAVKVEVDNIEKGKILDKITVEGNTVNNGETFIMPGKAVEVLVTLKNNIIFGGGWIGLPQQSNNNLEKSKDEAIKALDEYIKSTDDGKYNEDEKTQIKKIKENLEIELKEAKDDDEVKNLLEKAKNAVEKIAVQVNISRSVNEISLKSITKRLKNGKIKVYIKYSNGKQSIQELKNKGYKINYTFFRSSDKNGKYKKMMSKETAKYINTKGKNGKVYFYKISLHIEDPKSIVVYETPLEMCKEGKAVFGKKIK